RSVSRIHFLTIPRAPGSTLFPYTTLFRSGVPANFAAFADSLADRALAAPDSSRLKGWWVYRMLFGPDPLTERLTLLWHGHFATRDRKSTRLNSSHQIISYAVFCLKKKKK